MASTVAIKSEHNDNYGSMKQGNPLRCKSELVSEVTQEFCAPMRIKGLSNDVWDKIISLLDVSYCLKLLIVIKGMEHSKSLFYHIRKNVFGEGFLLANDRKLFSLYPQYKLRLTMVEVYALKFITEMDFDNFDVRVAFWGLDKKSFSGTSSSSGYDVFRIGWLNKLLRNIPNGVKVSIHGFNCCIGKLLVKLSRAYGNALTHIVVNGDFLPKEQHDCFRMLKRFKNLQSIVFKNIQYQWPTSNRHLSGISWTCLSKLNVVEFHKVFFPVTSSKRLRIKFPKSLRRFCCSECRQEVEYRFPKLVTHISLISCKLPTFYINVFDSDHDTQVMDLRGTEVDSPLLIDLKTIATAKGICFYFGAL